MTPKRKDLIKAKLKWEKDIQIYSNFLKGSTKTFEGRFQAEEYIALAKNRIEVIELKLSKLS